MSRRRSTSRGRGSGARAAEVTGNGAGLEQREGRSETRVWATGVGGKGWNRKEKLREGSTET